MLVALEMTFALIAYFAITLSDYKNIYFHPIFLCMLLVVLIISCFILSNLWSPFILLPLIAGFSACIGAFLGLFVNSLVSGATRSYSKIAIWIFGFVILVLLSSHSKYRSAYETFVACDKEAQSREEIQVVFDGNENKRFNLVLDPVFALISISVDHQNSFLWGRSKYPNNFSDSDLNAASCNLTRGFSRPVILYSYDYGIRISRETGELLRADVEHERDTYHYVDIKFRPHSYERKTDREVTMANGQSLRFRFRAIRTRGWEFSTDYHGLKMTFELEGQADNPPIQRAIMIIESFNDFGYLAPSEEAS